MRALRNRWLSDPVASSTPERPKTRADCIDGPRPCPWVGCRYHLALDVTTNGSIKLNFPNLEIAELPETCALDVAELKGQSIAQVAREMGLSDDRTFHLIDEAKRKLGEAAAAVVDMRGLQRRAMAEQREVKARISRKKRREE